MSIIKRANLGRPLTWGELDDNFSQVDSLVEQSTEAVTTATESATAALASATAAASSAEAAATSAEKADTYKIVKYAYTVTGGESTITIPDTYGDLNVQSIVVEGVTLQSQTGDFTYDTDKRVITLAEAFPADAKGTVITVQLGVDSDSTSAASSTLSAQFSQPNKIVNVQANKQAIARITSVESDAVAYLTVDLATDNYTVFYHGDTQSIWVGSNIKGTVKSWTIDGDTMTLVTSSASFTLTKFTSTSESQVTTIVDDAITALTDKLEDADGATTYPEFQMARWRDDGDIRGWGAKVDGKTDDSAAFTAALASSAEVIRVPAGTTVASFTMVSGKVLRGAGKNQTFIKTADATKTKLVSISKGTNFKISDITFNGGATAQLSSYEGLVHIEGCTGFSIVNVGATASGNGGIVIIDCDNISAKVRAEIRQCDIYGNKFEGLIALGKNTGIDIHDNYIADNSHHGVSFKPNAYPFTAGDCNHISFIGNTVSRNVGHGVFNAGLWDPSMTGDGDLDATYLKNTSQNNQFMKYSKFENNTINSNWATGMVLGGAHNILSNNVCNDNGNASTNGGFAGIVVSGFGMSVVGNVCQGNRSYGIDAGGAQSSTITGNTITNNSTKEEFCIGLNVGATSNTIVDNNTIGYNGTNVAGCTQVVFSGIDGDGLAAFTTIGVLGSISNNIIMGQSNNIGIRVHNMGSYVRLHGNQFTGISANNCITVRTSQSTYGPCSIRDNMLDSVLANGVKLASAATLVIPDGLDIIYVTGTTNITAIQTYSQNQIGSGITGVLMTNEGSGYDANNRPSISFGAGSGQTVQVEITRSGSIKGITASVNGTGFSTGDTVTFGAPASGGTQATGTVVAGAMNNAGRIINLFFESALTVNVSGMVSSYTSSAGSTLTLKGMKNGTWAIVSKGV